MKNKVYYGEYTLKHWIELILKKNIVLPDYQRYFVWSQNKTETLIETLKKKEFVPSIILGSMEIDKENKNIILDGQQRLTSIFLAYLKVFPNIKFKKEVAKYANENDDEEDSSTYDDVLNWRFDKLLEKGSNRKAILDKVEGKSEYKALNLEIDEEFFQQNYLGFSYIVPRINSISDEKEKEQQKFYSSVFRNINIQGEALLPQESRESLYYLNKNLKEYFNPKFIEEIYVNDAKIDFTRFLALIMKYTKEENINKIAYGYAKKMESFYEDFIYSVVEEDKEPDYSSKFNLLKETINELDYNKKYESIIDLDVYFFGLIYCIVFQNKKINLGKSFELKSQLKKKSEEYKACELHKKNPSALKYLRKRMEDSVSIYGEFTE